MAEALSWVLNRFLHEHKKLLGALANMTAQQLGLVRAVCGQRHAGHLRDGCLQPHG